MADDMDELGKLLHELAVDIASTVAADFVPEPPKDSETSAVRPVTLADKIDAFKALSPFYVAYVKASAKMPPKPNENVPTFGSMRDRIKAVEGGKKD